MESSVLCGQMGYHYIDKWVRNHMCLGCSLELWDWSFGTEGLVHSNSQACLQSETLQNIWHLFQTEAMVLRNQKGCTKLNQNGIHHWGVFSPVHGSQELWRVQSHPWSQMAQLMGVVPEVQDGNVRSVLLLIGGNDDLASWRSNKANLWIIM